MSDRQRIRVWDLPTRVFHWALVLLVVASFVSGKIGGNAMVWHGRFGLAILGLLSFRLLWGLIGSTYARFISFLPTPAAIMAYLRGQWRGLGHNPLGALSVFGLLGLLAFQVGSGLFANDDIAFRGPLYALVSSELSERLTGWHKLSVNLLVLLVLLHLTAIGFYAHVRKENLVRPMLTGWKEVAPEHGPPATGGGPLAFIVALLFAVAAVYAGSGEWVPPPAAAPVSAPAW
ncbi:cytochrome b/b6 domain-containing protein [Accumulibacter sp.]|uniref:cytochrome b/b6 domain-containing protein n=1 Tax=Accumulibacter sp. TaxID=2053492 RepID=UPI0025F40649|nr:cytochrome b/b6 domain-containing protein [Accumulibacter sp.]MCM8611527.1 cytochrome b/b6 domain-containing protein [Accumulibacter sp.]MCM8635161.1 cytochrome b/b6 domain-containing protein [Accumulibacter sp.]MCM8640493.1 cytochrome b/b6 domain-containing protein [Accumulibacter sp.]